jgi:hypothetical protein
MMSGFSYKNSSGEVKQVPVMYGDLSRQVGNVLRDNSENSVLSTPRMALYISSLELDTSRLADSSYVNKINIREREYDEAGNEYLNREGRNYTVERLMPTPYTLSVSVDIWSTNTDQKLQILEQILMLFNPALELQTTDNYLDWTSLTSVYLNGITWSSRTIPQGTESEIDVSTLEFETPIWIAPPAKVKRLGVITDIITRIQTPVSEFENELGDIDVNLPTPGETSQQSVYMDSDGELQTNRTATTNSEIATVMTILSTTYQNLDLLVLNSAASLVKNGSAGGMSWWEFFEAFPFRFEEGISALKLDRSDLDSEIAGYLAIDPSDSTKAVVNWDADTLPTDTVINSSLGSRSNIDYIIDPLRSSPENLDLSANPRILLLGSIGDSDNTDGAAAWKNQDGTDFAASEYDIVEWTGAEWQIVFDSDAAEDLPVFVTNLNTGVQYKYNGSEWLLSFEGEYQQGTWRIDF